MAHKKQISPSLMCADLLNLGAELKLLEKAGIEYLHIDIMDGVYVPNYTLGTDFVKRVKAATSIPLDIHMMVQNPGSKLDWFEFGEGEGQNWWCVLFPSLCLSAVKGTGDSVEAGLTPEQYRIITEDGSVDVAATDSPAPKYRLKFRFLELIEGLFRE